jgi:hypothetical protein
MPKRKKPFIDASKLNRIDSCAEKRRFQIPCSLIALHRPERLLTVHAAGGIRIAGWVVVYHKV